jgi:Flp pilus assembly pilin Flp
MIARFACLLRSDEGQDVIEYGLLGAFISVAAVLTIKLIGPLVDDMYASIQTALTP